MFQINLFTCTSERNRIDKSDYISNRFTMEGALRNESSVTNPVILIEKTNPVSVKYNYMYIEEFKRWYFIDDIVSVRDKLWEIHASVDVLYSFKNDILSTYCILEKAENEDDANLYLDDGSFVLDSRKYNTVIPFPSGLNDNGSYILICAGGV